MEQFTPSQCQDLKVLISFVRLYCRLRHGAPATSPTKVELPTELGRHFARGVQICPDCAGMVGYAMEKRRRCPLDPKPSCKHCHIHCYSPEYRAKIREIMAFSGRRMLLRGRLDYLWHYFF